MKTRPQMTIVEETIRMPALAQRLAEEAQDAQAVDVAEDAAAELRDLAERGEPVLRDAEPAATHGRAAARLSG